jgi:hypothetical protein
VRRFALLSSMSALVIVSACSDRTTSPIATPERPRLSLPVPGQLECAELTERQIYALIDAVYADGSPDEQAALSKWDNITKQRAAAREGLVREKIIDLVDFTLTKHAEGKLAATDAQLVAMVNALFCYGGMANEYYYPGGGGQFIYPLDAKQTIFSSDCRVAITFEFDPVDQPTLVTITRTTDTLDTMLDKYERVYEFSKYPSASTFKQPAITEVCAEVSDDLFPELVLGHNRSNGVFELLEKPSPDRYSPVLTQCGTPEEERLGFASAVGAKLLELLLPQKLYAAMIGGGGVTGSVDNLSPIGPVDPRVKVVKSSVLPAHKPIGTTLSPAAQVTLSSYTLNTPIRNVPVSFATASGSVSASPVNTLPADGSASTVWTLGLTPGTVTLRATPSYGGDAVDGVVFLGGEQTPGSGLFDTFQAFSVEATAASRIALTDGVTLKAVGSSVPAGAMPSVRAVMVDAYGDTVAAFSGQLTASLTQGNPTAQPRTFNVPSATSITANNGVAIFSALRIHTAGSDYRISIDGTGLTSGTTGLFTVTPAAPIVEKIAGDAQTADAGTTLGLAAGTVAPRVRVRDVYGNLWTDRQVFWQTFDGSTVPAPSTMTSTTTAQTSTNWTIGGGPNELFATVTPNSFEGTEFAVFTATGIRERAVLQSCGTGMNRVDAADNYMRWTSRLPSRINSLELYLSITNNAAKDRLPVTLRLVAYEATETSTRGVFNAPVEKASVQMLAALKGNAAEDAPVNFVFENGYVPTSGARLTFRVFRIAGGENGALRFNTGACNNSAMETVNLSTDAVERPTVAFQMR